MYTATAAMVLCERGVIDLDDPVSQYVAEFADVLVAVADDCGGATLVAPARPITVYHLLTHTAGLAITGDRARGLSWGLGAAVASPSKRKGADAATRYGWVGGGFAKLWVDRNEDLIAYINVPLTPPGDNALLNEFEQRVYAAFKQTGEWAQPP